MENDRPICFCFQERSRLLLPAGVEYMIESTAKFERSAIVYSKLRFVAVPLFALVVAVPSHAASDQSPSSKPDERSSPKEASQRWRRGGERDRGHRQGCC